MNYLLDTHSFLWFINGDRELSENARMAIEKDGALNYVSIASLWEIAIKISLGKLISKIPFAEIETQISNNSFLVLPVSFNDTLVLSTLPFYHRDPFDRMLIAQGITNDLTVITRDTHFNNYKVKTVW